MTFFANSGVAWPDVENETRQAGADSLRAASRLFDIFANLESGDTLSVSEDEAVFCAEALKRTANTYQRIGTELRDATVPTNVLTQSEFADWFGPFPYVEETWLHDWSLGSSIPVGAMFRELSKRADTLAATIRDLKPDIKAWDLAPTVFRIMKQWEALERLARFVAAVNRRKL
jgi:hypothetical protein